MHENKEHENKNTVSPCFYMLIFTELRLQSLLNFSDIHKLIFFSIF